MNGLRERLVAGTALALLAAGFAWLNGGARADVNLGIVRIEAVPLPLIVFVAFLLGMLTLFLASLKAELRMQRRLQRYREALGRDAKRPAPPAAEAAPAADADPAADEA